MANRIPINIPVLPWFRDHSFNGKVIFPAVETMLLLAQTATEMDTGLATQQIHKASFSKLLEIPKEAITITALVEHEETADGLCCRLLSKIQFKKISRVKEHAALYFRQAPEPLSPVPLLSHENDDFLIDARRIYHELVPFGRAYRTITGNLHLRKGIAIAQLRAAKVVKQQQMEPVLGSPFPLDGAMHAACVLGQCSASFIPFPVGLASRLVSRPTKAGEEYVSSVELVSQTENELFFDLSIYTVDGELCETVKGLRMRDVTGGMITPPADLPRVTASPSQRGPASGRR